MRPPSPESQTPDTLQGNEEEEEEGAAARRMEPDTTQPAASRETTESLVTMMRYVHGIVVQRFLQHLPRLIIYKIYTVTFDPLLWVVGI